MCWSLTGTATIFSWESNKFDEDEHSDDKCRPENLIYSIFCGIANKLRAEVSLALPRKLTEPAGEEFGVLCHATRSPDTTTQLKLGGSTATALKISEIDATVLGSLGVVLVSTMAIGSVFGFTKFHNIGHQEDDSRLKKRGGSRRKIGSTIASLSKVLSCVIVAPFVKTFRIREYRICKFAGLFPSL